MCFLIFCVSRLPFYRDPACIKLKKTVLKLSIELASTTQRDQFAERPHSLIKRNVSFDLLKIFSLLIVSFSRRIPVYFILFQ